MCDPSLAERLERQTAAGCTRCSRLTCRRSPVRAGEHESVGSDDLGRTVVDLVPEFVKRTELPVGREKTVTLEEELKHLEANESALEQRTNSLALANGLGLISGILAFGLALLALVVALSNRDNNNGTGQMRSGSAGAAMGAGAMMGSTAAGNAARPVCERSTSSSARCG